MNEKPEQTGSARDDWTEKSTGDGGPLGVPWEGGGLPESGEAEDHEVVSGGGVVEHEELDGDEATTSTE